MQNLSITTYKNIIYKIVIYLVLFFSCLVRFFAYFQNRPLWHDECLLALNVINHNFFGLFLPFDDNQSAPSMFLVFTKFLTILFGENELVLRFLPFVFSIASVFVFYLLTKKIFSQKWLLVLANLLFALNLPLIYYSQEFKQYSLEVFFAVFSLLIFSKISIKSFDVKKAVVFAFLSFLPFLFSFSYVFVFAAYLLYELFNSKTKPNRPFWVFISVSLVLFIFSYFLILLPQKQSSQAFLLNYWDSGFIRFDFSIFKLFINNLKYFFAPNLNLLFIALFVVLGFLKAFKSKNKILKICAISILLGIIAAMLQIYPIKERLALWSLPILIIFICDTLNFDFKKVNKIFVGLLLFTFLCTFSGYGVKYLTNIKNGGIYYITSFFHSYEDARFALNILKNNYKKSDIIVLNKASIKEWEYYSRLLDFSVDNYIVINPNEYSKQLYFNELNMLKKGKDYIFYHSYDYYSSQLSPYLNEWIYDNAQKIYFIEKIDRTYLAKVRL